HTYLLPFLEQRNVAQQIDLTKAWIAPENLPPPLGTNAMNPYNPSIRVFACPSVPQRTADYGELTYLTVTPGIAVFGVTDYAVLDGIGAPFTTRLNEELTDPVTAGRTGVLQFAVFANGQLNPKARMTRAGDGLSNCIFFAEDAGRPAIYEL